MPRRLIWQMLNKKVNQVAMIWSCMLRQESMGSNWFLLSLLDPGAVIGQCWLVTEAPAQDNASKCQMEKKKIAII